MVRDEGISEKLREALRATMPTAAELAEQGGWKLETFRSWVRARRVPDRRILREVAALLYDRAHLLGQHAAELEKLAKEDR